MICLRKLISCANCFAHQTHLKTALVCKKGTFAHRIPNHSLVASVSHERELIERHHLPRRSQDTGKNHSPLPANFNRTTCKAH